MNSFKFVTVIVRDFVEESGGVPRSVARTVKVCEIGVPEVSKSTDLLRIISPEFSSILKKPRLFPPSIANQTSPLGPGFASVISIVKIVEPTARSSATVVSKL